MKGDLFDLDAPSVAVVGHPFSSIGMGEQVRAGYSALAAVGINARFYDVFRHVERSDVDLRQLVAPNEIQDLNDHTVRIFHINGDEVDTVRATLKERRVDFRSAYNIIVPVWELPTYPKVWKSKLAFFDEVWAPSRFVKASFDAIGIQGHHVGQAVEKTYPTLFGRRYFGIRKSAFVILNFFDTKSYPRRKNPEGILELYRRIRKAMPFDDIQLVLKMREGDASVTNVEVVMETDIPRDVRLLSTNLTSHETFSLLSASDCFASLHRSEGFGRGLAEAMWLGRLALGTGWSGNRDYMEQDNSLMVNYHLVDVGDGDYPHSGGQQWAEPDIDHAVFLLKAVINDPGHAQAIVRRARIAAILNCSNRAVGLRMAARLSNRHRIEATASDRRLSKARVA